MDFLTNEDILEVYYGISKDIIKKYASFKYHIYNQTRRAHELIELFGEKLIKIKISTSVQKKLFINILFNLVKFR